jgi:hypothetical protein
MATKSSILATLILFVLQISVDSLFEFLKVKASTTTLAKTTLSFLLFLSLLSLMRKTSVKKEELKSVF